VAVTALVSVLFSWYAANFGNYNATYGSLGALVGLLTWMWLSIVILLIGAELNSEVEHQTASDSTTGHPRALGQRGAQMADHVAVVGPGAAPDGKSRTRTGATKRPRRIVASRSPAADIGDDPGTKKKMRANPAVPKGAGQVE